LNNTIISDSVKAIELADFMRFVNFLNKSSNTSASMRKSLKLMFSGACQGILRLLFHDLMAGILCKGTTVSDNRDKILCASNAKKLLL